MATQPKQTLSCPISTKFTPATYRRLQKASKDSKRHFNMSTVPVAEIIRVAVDRLLDDLDAKAKTQTKIS